MSSTASWAQAFRTVAAFLVLCLVFALVYLKGADHGYDQGFSVGKQLGFEAAKRVCIEEIKKQAKACRAKKPTA